MEPMYQGEPILAVAAVDELTAAEAIEKIEIEFEPLPFVGRPDRESAAGQRERAHPGQRLDASASSGHAGNRRGRPRRAPPPRPDDART